MQKLLNYPIIGLIILVILLIVYIDNLQNHRDKLLNQLDTAKQDIEQLEQINKNLNGSVDLLEKQMVLTNNYISDLENANRLTEQKATQAQESFRKAKHENQTISDWANMPLPSGLLSN